MECVESYPNQNSSRWHAFSSQFGAQPFSEFLLGRNAEYLIKIVMELFLSSPFFTDELLLIWPPKAAASSPLWYAIMCISAHIIVLSSCSPLSD